MARVYKNPRSSLLGTSLKTIRRMRGYDQDDLAVLADTTQQTISLIEKGKANPTKRTLDNIAKALDADITFIATR